ACPTGTSASRRWRSTTPTSRPASTTSTSSPPTSCSTPTRSTWWWPRTSSGPPGWMVWLFAQSLFGDILSDLGPAIAGSIGIAPGGNINPEKEYPSMFEPVHGSAPDIAGKNVANPIAQIWTGAMMLDHLGHPDAAKAVVGAIEKVVKQ